MLKNQAIHQPDLLHVRHKFRSRAGHLCVPVAAARGPGVIRQRTS